MDSKLIKSSAAVILAGMIDAGTALAADDLEVTMDVLGDGEQVGAPVSQIIRLPEPASVHEQTRIQAQDAQGQTRQVRHEYRYSQSGAAQDDTSQQREQNREMQEESRQVREEAHEQARELREQAQEEISQMREETTSLREEFRDMRSNGR
jgi:hypothetical protein